MNTDTPTTNARWEKLCCSGQSWYQIAEEMKLDCRQLERELTAAREELAEWRILNGWGGTPEIINDFIKGQQTRIHYAQNLEEELAAVTEQRDQWKDKYIQQNKDLGHELRDPNGTIWSECKRLQTELTAVTEQRDRAWQKIENQAERITYLEGATNHATGTPLSKAIEQRDRLAEQIEANHKGTLMLEQMVYDAREQRDRLLEEREQWRLSSVCRELTEQRDRLAEVLRRVIKWMDESGYYDVSPYHQANEALQSLTPKDK
jgi:hypothetical protein